MANQYMQEEDDAILKTYNRYPVVLDHGDGAYLYDPEGKKYLDFSAGYAVSSLGYNNKEFNDALKAQIDKMIHTSNLYYNTTCGKAGEDLKKITGMNKVFFTNSGGEAIEGAIKTARKYAYTKKTGRYEFIAMENSFHGRSMGAVALTGHKEYREPFEPVMPGVHFAIYNDLDSVKALLEQAKGQVAAVIVEPVAANMGVVAPKKGFLEGLRTLCDQHGTLLIFDEVITGFRLSLGGAQQYYNIKPDITTLGKIVGGGMPIGAYGGRREIMHMISPDGPVYQAGTLSGNPVATTAGIETLNILKNDPQIYERLEQKTRKLADAAREAGKGHICVNQIGSLMSVFFTDQKVRDFESAVTSNTEQYADYFGYLLDRGIYIAPSQFETMFISNAHTEEDIEKTCKLAGEALCSLDF